MIAVVAGVVERDGRCLLCQRPEGKNLALKWEFPGGKLEHGETPEAALERELYEELGVRTRTGRILDVIRRQEGELDLLVLFYVSELLSAISQKHECRAIAWVRPDELRLYDLAPADALFARRRFENDV